MPLQAKGQVRPEKSAYHSIALLAKSSEKDISLVLPRACSILDRSWIAARSQFILIYVFYSSDPFRIDNLVGPYLLINELMSPLTMRVANNTVLTGNSWGT